MEPNSFKLIFADHTFEIFGGPYVDRPDNMLGVKMAAEIKTPYNINCPTRDFSVPDKDVFHLAVLNTLALILAGQKVYVGCMGGIGRTGLMMAALTKISMADNKDTETDPVQFVRDTFDTRAVETSEQLQMIADFDVRGHLGFIGGYWMAERVPLALNLPKPLTRWERIRKWFTSSHWTEFTE